jgi:hypothetical protein
VPIAPSRRSTTVPVRSMPNNHGSPGSFH